MQTTRIFVFLVILYLVCGVISVPFALDHLCALILRPNFLLLFIYWLMFVIETDAVLGKRALAVVAGPCLTSVSCGLPCGLIVSSNPVIVNTDRADCSQGLCIHINKIHLHLKINYKGKLIVSNAFIFIVELAAASARHWELRALQNKNHGSRTNSYFLERKLMRIKDDPIISFSPSSIADVFTIGTVKRRGLPWESKVEGNASGCSILWEWAELSCGWSMQSGEQLDLLHPGERKNKAQRSRSHVSQSSRIFAESRSNAPKWFY